MKINWFLNLNQAVDLNPTNLFYGNEIIINKSFLVISSSQFLYVIDKFNGSIILKKDIVSNIKPLIVENYLFLVTKNYLLVVIDLNIKKIIYSYDINSKVAEFLNLKNKRTVSIKDIMMVNDNLYLFLKNSYILKFNKDGNIISVRKLPTQISSVPIIANRLLIYINNRKKINIIN